MSSQKQTFEIGDLVKWNAAEDPNFPKSLLGIIVRTKRNPLAPPGKETLYQVFMNDWGKEMWFEEHALSKKA